MVIMILLYEPVISLHVCTWLVVADTDSRMPCSTDTDSRVACSKKYSFFINCVQLQGFPIDSHTFAWVRRKIRRDIMCMECLYVCKIVWVVLRNALQPLTHWVHLEDWRLNVHMNFSSFKSHSEGLLPECSVSVKEVQSEDNSSLSTHGNLRMVYCELSQLRTITDKLCGKLLTDGMHGS